MSDSTAIQWTDATWNIVTGCTRVSPGCARCYIERTPPFRMAGRAFARVGNAETTGIQLHPDRLDAPLRWRKPRRVFVCSLADLFHEEVPDEHIELAFVVMARASQHTFQVLTKRPERARDLLSDAGTRNFIVNRAASETTSMYRGKGWVGAVPEAQPQWPLPNVWIGTSVENQRWADVRIPILNEIPAAIRFLSCEPLLGPVTFRWRPWAPLRNANHLDSIRDSIDWVIVGGESGPGARKMDILWARQIVHECAEAGIATFVKQLGAQPIYMDDLTIGVYKEKPLKLLDKKGGDIAEWPADLRVREFPLGTVAA